MPWPLDRMTCQKVKSGLKNQTFLQLNRSGFNMFYFNVLLCLVCRAGVGTSKRRLLNVLLFFKNIDILLSPLNNLIAVNFLKLTTFYALLREEKIVYAVAQIEAATEAS
ncbi:MAG: hypothetical protein GF401_04725 [Chitinivibrionales bacterium]|nr:hypothetical protein [Chitinivibrionales bacterium]